MHADPPPEPNPDDPLEQQQWLVESSLPLVFATYDEAIADGLPHPVVVLVDCEDELGSQIARGWLGDDTVDDAIADQPAESDDGQPLTTVFARAVAWSEMAGLAEAFPYLSGALAEGPPRGGVMVVGVTAGGASALTAPWDARP
ncbi:hypothetical protein [Botrimarina sp.]|uniref:hypothetical protein n=1 Tax=Botrimarina sp. TaxID=2795802 RepID=UPI0032EC6317